MPTKKDETPKSVKCPNCKSTANIRKRFTGRSTCLNCGFDFK